MSPPRRRGLALALLATFACVHLEPPAAPHPATDALRVANLHAFARLYGVVRWFHPSDAASAIDWDRFAIDGVHRVLDAPTPAALRAALTELFAPIAPTMHIAGPGESLPDEPALRPASTDEVVAWQHQGFGDTTFPAAYFSKRRHRDQPVPAPIESPAALFQALDATPYRGARVRLRGRLRTAHHGRGQLWLRIDSPHPFLEAMDDDPVRAEDWTRGEIIGRVDPAATAIAFGVYRLGRGTVWYDDLELSVERAGGVWQPIEIRNPSFETAPLDGWAPGVGRAGRNYTLAGWRLTRDPDRPASGAASLRIESETTLRTQELFEAMPAPGETVELALGRDLRARVPIALYSRAGHTIGDDVARARRSQRPAAPPRDGDARIADAIVAWNALEHFWPYWDTVQLDPMRWLDDTLRHALAEHDIHDHVATLEQLGVALPDAHAYAVCAGHPEPADPPIALTFADDRIVVLDSADPAVLRGDVLVAIDGRPAAQALAAAETRFSGSPQWRLLNGLQEIGAGPSGAAVHLTLERGGRPIEALVTRTDQLQRERPAHPPIDRLDDGTYYVDLSRTEMTELDAILPRLAAAPGIVFDVRQRPNQTHGVLSHLVTRLDPPAVWESIPQIIRPDHAGPAGWTETSSWNMPQIEILAPHLAGRVAFLVGPSTVSYAESVMAIVAYYHLGAIVGSPTAGTNGDFAILETPLGCTVRFTGERVTEPGGARFHLRGIQPTIPVQRTLAGITAGRDETLERALTYVRTGS